MLYTYKHEAQQISLLLWHSAKTMILSHVITRESCKVSTMRYFNTLETKAKKIFVRRESRIRCWKVRDGRKKEWIFNLHRCVLLYIKYKRSKWERKRSHKTPLNICFEAEKVLWKSVSMDSFFKSAAGGQYKATWFHKYFISNIKLPQVFVLRKMLFYPSRRHTEVYWLY